MTRGSSVAAELGHIFEALGTEVTIVNRGPRLLGDEDDDVSSRFTQAYARRFDLRLDAEVTAVLRRGSEVALRLVRDGQPEEVVGDALLVATGRVPNTDLLAVERCGIALDEEGFIKTDAYLRTNVPGVWALGDIVGEFMLKHSANLEAAHVAPNLLHPDDLQASNDSRSGWFQKASHFRGLPSTSSRELPSNWAAAGWFYCANDQDRQRSMRVTIASPNDAPES